MGTPAAVKVGPGLLYIAPLGTAEPTTGSGALPSAWVAVGYTEAGSEFDFNTTYADIDVAEELDPIRIVATGRISSVKFSMAEITARNISKALNGGTISSPLAGFVTFEPPALGAEVRVMLCWQSDDAQEQWLFRRCLSTASVNIAHAKAPAKSQIPVEFRTEIPTDGSKPFKAWISSALNYTV